MNPNLHVTVLWSMFITPRISYSQNLTYLEQITPNRKADELNADEETCIAFPSTSQYDQATAILMAFDGLSLPDSDQEKPPLLAKNGELKPIILSSGATEKSYDLLTSCKNVPGILEDQPNGLWSLPVTKRTKTDTTLSTNSLLSHIIMTSPLYRRIASQKYVELTKSMTDIINRDWILFPQLRYFTATLFAGSIFVNKSTAILVNCTEPYGRLKTTDAHSEQRHGSSLHLISSPRYGYINTVIVNEDNVRKLKIGTTSCNLLVTSSVRLDKNSMTTNIVKIGANTANFTPSDDPYIYLDGDSVNKANMLLNDKAASSINGHCRTRGRNHG